MQHFQSRLFLAYLFLTIAIETPILLALIRKFFKIPAEQIGTRYILLTGFLASFSTYPYVWYIWPALTEDEGLALIYAELMVFVVESLMIKQMLKLSFKQALIASAVCNLTTILLGSIMNKLIIEYRLFLF